MIGIGVGNSDYEVGHFRKTYNVPFPLFSDGDFAIHKKIGEAWTPHFFGVRLNTDGSNRIFYSQLGGKKAADKILAELMSAAGLNLN